MAIQLADADKAVLDELVRDLLAAASVAAITSGVCNLRAALTKLDPRLVFREEAVSAAERYTIAPG